MSGALAIQFRLREIVQEYEAKVSGGEVTPRCVHKALEAGTLDRVGMTKWGVTTRSGPARTPDARSDP
jgi:hypothetical protein